MPTGKKIKMTKKDTLSSGLKTLVSCRRQENYLLSLRHFYITLENKAKITNLNPDGFSSCVY